MTARRSPERGAEWRTQEVHGGATDLALFGAVPVAFVLAPTRADAQGNRHVIASAPHNEAATRGSSVVPTSAAHAISLDLPHIGSVMPIVGHSAVTGTPSTSASNAVGPAIIDQGHVATFVPAPHGTSSLAAAQQAQHQPHIGATVAPIAVIITDAANSHVVPAPAQMAAVDEAMASIRASAGALQGALATLAERVQGVGALGQDTVHDALAQVHDTVAGIVGQMPDVHQLLADASADTTATVNNLTAQVAVTIDHATSGIAGTVGDVTTHLGATTGAVSGITSGAAQDVATLTGNTTGALQDVLGNDPHGGIATLVGMVHASDVFDLHDDTIHSAGLTPALGALGATELLADLHPAAVLPGLIDSHTHDLGLHDGLFGHG